MTAQPLRYVDQDGRRQPAKAKLTQARVRKVQPPAQGRLTIYDEATRGLALVVTATDSRAWYLIRKVNGRARRIRLAGGDMALEDARKLARQTIVDIENGSDPVAERRARRAKVATLAEAWETYTRERERSPRTVRAEASLWKNIGAMASRGLDAITTEQLAALHSRLGKQRGHTTANRTLELVRRVYRFTQRRRLFDGRNPAEGVGFFRERSRERFITPDELPGLLEAIDAEPDPWPDYFRLLLMTGARRSALAMMRWQDVDLEAGTWRIPAEHSKNKEGVTVPLVDEAVERLKRRRTEVDQASPWVFPASRRRGEHITNPQHAWGRVRKAAGLGDVTLHDIRRTTGSYLAAAGVSLPMIGKALGHRSTASTMVYSRLDVSDVRRELAHVTDAMRNATNGKGADDE